MAGKARQRQPDLRGAVPRADPDPGGHTFWTNQLNTKAKTRGDVMVHFSESSEGKRFLAPQAHAILAWLSMLDAVPSKGNFVVILEFLKAGGEPSEFVVEAIRVSSPYAAKA